MIAKNEDDNIIYSYTRQQAIEDGVLVDLSQNEVIRQHWKHPFACTETVWNYIDTAIREYGNDLNGILHDISTFAKLKISRNRNADYVAFYAKIGGELLHLKLHLGPGDTRAPVMTLILADED